MYENNLDGRRFVYETYLAETMKIINLDFN